nr:cation-translocating P-type ATPase C-terminal domain-containing protein [Streptomyces acidicola]
MLRTKTAHPRPARRRTRRGTCHRGRHAPPAPAPEESVLGAGLWPRILLMGAFIATLTLAAGVWARETDRPWQSMMFLVLGATQLGVALGSRARPGSLANPFLLVAVGTALSLQAAGVYLPPLRDLLGTEPLSPADLDRSADNGRRRGAWTRVLIPW